MAIAGAGAPLSAGAPRAQARAVPSHPRAAATAPPASTSPARTGGPRASGAASAAGGAARRPSAAPLATPSQARPTTTAQQLPSPSSTPSAPADGVIHSDGHGHLTLNGHPYQFLGVDAFELATNWGINYGCGYDVANLDGFFSLLSPNSVVRFWAFQDFAVNKNTHARDWTALDLVVHAAERAHQRLILVLADQWANCHGELYKDAAFYNGGYRTATAPGELEPYWDWVTDAVTRYRNSAAVGMWEPINEAQGDCYSIFRGQLHAFFDAVGGHIKSIDPVHLVESGLLGTGQCGTTGIDYTVVQDTPNIDVVSYHDYGDPSPVPGALQERLQEAAAMNKPLIVGEVGNPGLAQCPAMNAKYPAQFSAGVAGFLPWNWGGPGDGTCGF
jgi:hypothetical protein